MEVILRELNKLEAKSCAASEGIEALQAGIEALERWQALLDASPADDLVSMDEDGITEVAVDHIEVAVAKLAEGHKEWSSALSKYSKAVDKKFATDIAPLLPPVSTEDGSEIDDAQMFFSSDSSRKAINRVLLTHFSRSGEEALASMFAKESDTTLTRDKEHHFQAMHRIATSIAMGDLRPVFDWINDNRAFLHARRPSLEYRLHRSQFVRLLLSDTYALPAALAADIEAAESHSLALGMNGVSFAGAKRAIDYARQHPHIFYGEWAPAKEVSRLITASLYLPLSRLAVSPYGGLFTASGQPIASTSQPLPTEEDIAELYHAPQLVELFTSEFCASLGMPKDLSLKVVTDIGGGGALAKIAKVRGVMKEKRTEWTTTQELPVEIPLPPEYRFHSVFACPVSKEQATESNPPMMMPCGHVVASQTLHRLCKGGQTVRCPYCPLSSAVSQAIRLYF